MNNRKKLFLGLAATFIVIYLFIRAPIIIIMSSSIELINFNTYFEKISKHIPNNQDVKVKEFYLLFNGKSGKIERFTSRLVFSSEKIDDIYYVKYWPMLKITTVNHSQKASTSDNKEQLSGIKLFAALNNIDYENILNSKKAYYYAILSSLDNESRLFHKEPGRENFMLNGRKLIRLDYEVYYPKSFEFLLIGDNKVIRSYLVN